MRKYSLFFVTLYLVLLLCACTGVNDSTSVTKNQILTEETTGSTTAKDATETLPMDATECIPPSAGRPTEPNAPTWSDPDEETSTFPTTPKQENTKPEESEGQETLATQPSQVPGVEETLPEEETAPEDSLLEGSTWITYEEFMSMTGQEQMEYWYTFQDPMDYIEWYQTVIGGHDQENQPDEGEGNEGMITQPTAG